MKEGKCVQYPYSTQHGTLLFVRAIAALTAVGLNCRTLWVIRREWGAVRWPCLLNPPLTDCRTSCQSLGLLSGKPGPTLPCGWLTNFRLIVWFLASVLTRYGSGQNSRPQSWTTSEMLGEFTASPTPLFSQKYLTMAGRSQQHCCRMIRHEAHEDLTGLRKCCLSCKIAKDLERVYIMLETGEMIPYLKIK